MELLIDNEKLIIDNFKRSYTLMTWLRVPRKLGCDHTDYFYVGKYDDEEKSIIVSIRPSMRMQISESFKNRTLDGKIPPEGYKGQLCEWGSTVEVIVEPSFLHKIKEISTEKPINQVQRIGL